MSELSRSLADAAAGVFPVDPCAPEGDVETVVNWEVISTTETDRAEEINLPEFYSVAEFGPVEQIARAAVAAVLEKLAGEAHSFNDDLRLHKHQRDSLRRLAAQVREASR